MKKFLRFLPHLLVAFSFTVMTMVVLNEYNPMQKFLTSTPSKIMMLLLCITALAVAIMKIIEDNRE